MEDEDEFGDLYTDVLRPPSSATPPQPPAPPFLASSSASAKPSADSLFQSHEDGGDEDEDFLYVSPPKTSYKPPSQALAPQPIRFLEEESAQERRHDASTSPYRKQTNCEGNAILDAREPETAEASVRNEDFAEVSDERVRVLESLDGADGVRGSEEFGRGNIPEAEGENGDLSVEKMGIDVEVGDLDAEPVIPGLSTDTFVPFHGPGEVNTPRGKRNVDAAAAAAGDDSDSDSEDDLQIVLNDNTGPVVAERSEGAGSDDEDDEDGEDLVIVADDGALLSQPVEDQDWGEESAPAAADGERKDAGEAAKVNGGLGGVVGTRIGYSNHGYHPHHSQFKYVRPGAGVPPGTVPASNGASGQVRPSLTMGPVAGRGRGDWRPMGMKSMPTMQKSFHPGYGSSVWATNSSGRPFGGGMEFTLPSHKTVFDVDIDSFEEKPWRYPGVDISNYFNFGLSEDHWKEYCKQLDQLRLEATMQSKIRVYESGRSEQDFDPDLPPELAAAAGLHDASVNNANQGKTAVGQGDFMAQGRPTTRIRPPLPTGRAIQVEGGYGERLPSIDTRPPRNRDSDAVIEIICHDPVNDNAVTSNGTSEPENETQVEEFKGGNEIEEDEYGNRLPSTSDRRKREKMATRTPDMGCGHDDVIAGGGLPSCPSEAPVPYHRSFNIRGQVYPSGESGPSLGGRSPQEASRERCSDPSGDNVSDVKSHHCSDIIQADTEQNEKSKDDFEGKQIPEGSSTEEVEAVKELSLERREDGHDDQLALADSTEYGRDEIASDLGAPGQTQEESSLDHSIKKQKLSSRVESATQQIENGDEMRPTHSDSSKGRSGSSRDYQRRREGGEDEVVQDGRSRCGAEARRIQDGDEPIYRRRDDYGRDGRHEVERSHLVLRGRDDAVHSCLHRDCDSSSGHYSRVKEEGLERQKERGSSVGAWQRREENVQRRRPKDGEIKRCDRVEETRARHRGRVHESERTEKDDHLFSRKRVEDGDWRGRHEKEIRSTKQREWEDIALGRRESLEESHYKRRKEDGPQKRELDKGEILHGYRATEERRKREREDLVDSRRRDDPVRQRDKLDEHHQSVRHREENWRQREREDRQRVKQLHEENKWVGSGRTKDESKGLICEKDYPHRDKRRHMELPKRREILEEDTSLQHRGREDVYSRDNQFNYEEKNSRHEKSTGQNDRLVGSYKEKHKENPRMSKESEVSDQNAVGHGNRRHDDHGTHKNEKVTMRSTSVQESNIISPSDPADSHDHGPSRSSTATCSKKGHHHHHHYHHHHHDQTQHSSSKREEDSTMDNEVQHGSRRGRSKLEHWTSQKERDVNPNSHSSSIAKSSKESGNDDGRSVGTEQSVERNETVAAVNNETNRDLNKDPDVGHSSEDKKVDLDKVGDDPHMDTFAKLKKRSERFKLPMPSEKDTSTNRRVENEAVVSQSGNPTSLEIKQERPARKRRWVGS